MKFEVFMTRHLAVAVLAACLSCPCVCSGERIDVDIRAWIATGTGTDDDGWVLRGLSGYNDGGAQFDAQSDYAISPVFEDVVTQIVMSVKSSSLSVPKILTITPMNSKGAAVHEANPTTVYQTEIFSWGARESVRQFCIQESSGATGNWGVRSLAVYTDRIEPPDELRDDPLYSDAFNASWDAAPRADRYQVRYASVVRTPSCYETVAQWDFSSLTNASGLTSDLNSLQGKFPEILGGLSGTNVCMQGYESGHIQIGKGENLGIMDLPHPIGGSDLTGILCAWKYPAEAKTTMPICFVKGSATNDLATIEISTNRVEYHFPLPVDFSADCILLSSTTNGLALKDKNGRVRVESFAIVSNYVESSVTTNGFAIIGARTTERMVKDLGPGEWVWSARSFDVGGRDSPWSPLRTVVLDPLRPRRPRPGFSVRIR